MYLLIYHIREGGRVPASGLPYTLCRIDWGPLTAAVDWSFVDMEKKFYKIKEVQAILGVSKSMLYEHVLNGRIPSRRLGKRILIPESFVQEMLMVKK